MKRCQILSITRSNSVGEDELDHRETVGEKGVKSNVMLLRLLRCGVAETYKEEE